ncbi:MAG: hypothetical protein R6X10_01980 [Desulfobacterales bacterium]
MKSSTLRFNVYNSVTIMRIDHSVVHRKVFTPWYDTETICILLIFFLFLVFLFSLAGISVCGENPEFRDHVWIPVFLLFASGMVLVSIIIRLARRTLDRYQNRYLKDFSSDGLE